MHDVRFPNETESYRQARDKLLQSEIELRALVETVAAQRRELPLGGEIPEDYEFILVDAKTKVETPIKMSKLFGKHKELIIYTYMFGDSWDKPCPSCTSVLDAFHSAAEHVKQRAALAISAAASPKALANWAEEKGWQGINLVSAKHNRFNFDYHVQGETDDALAPTVQVFIKESGKIYHSWATELLYKVEKGQHPRHVDQMWPVWNILDLLPNGRADFNVRHQYED